MQLKKIFLLLCLSATMNVVSAQEEINIYDTYYYEYSEVLFGESVDNEGNVVGENTTFKIGSSGSADIVVMIANEGAFGTETLVIYIYDEDMNPVDEFSINIESEWNWVKFSISLKEEGKYYVDVYNEVDTFVNTGELFVEK